MSKDDLSEVDTRAGSKTRDLIRKVALGVNFAIAGIENQNELDYELPVRIMNYDAVHYKKQVAQIGKKVKGERKSLKPGEYMYGFSKESRLFPVVTFVLYAGVEPWDGPQTLYDMIDFKTDVKYVFDFIRCAEDWNKLLKLVSENAYYQNMDEEAYEVVSKYANLKDDMVSLEEYKREDGGMDMCKGIRDLIEISKAEGKESVIVNMLNKGMAIEEICELAECDEACVERIRKENGI